jgi:hypothetical protein
MHLIFLRFRNFPVFLLLYAQIYQKSNSSNFFTWELCSCCYSKRVWLNILFPFLHVFCQPETFCMIVVRWLNKINRRNRFSIIYFSWTGLLIQEDTECVLNWKCNLFPRASVWGRGERRGSPGLGRSRVYPQNGSIWQLLIKEWRDIL